jgi:hypothetical protein
VYSPSISTNLYPFPDEGSNELLTEKTHFAPTESTMTPPSMKAYEKHLKTLDIGFNGVSVSTDLQGTVARS